MTYVFDILETDADQNWPNRHENALRGSKNESKIAHGAPKVQLGTPNGAQRKPKEISEEGKGDFGRAKVDPRAPRCAPRDAPRERQGGPSGGLMGSHMASKMGKESPKSGSEEE